MSPLDSFLMTFPALRFTGRTIPDEPNPYFLLSRKQHQESARGDSEHTRLDVSRKVTVRPRPPSHHTATQPRQNIIADSN